jgi:hypothetical protein
MKNHLIRVLGIALLLGAVATIAFAGGPNYIFDPANKIPYVWKMEHWTGGAVPVYTDLGNLELLTNAQATDWAVRAWDQWNNVPSSTFRAHVVGNVSLLGRQPPRRGHGRLRHRRHDLHELPRPPERSRDLLHGVCRARDE